MNRASGAASVGDRIWEQKQQDAINSYMTRLGLLLSREATARQVVAATFAATGKPNVDISPQLVLAFERQLAFQGWRPDQVQRLLDIGDDIAFIQGARPLIYTQDINAVAGTVPAAFAKPALIATLLSASKALVPSLGIPPVVSCHGVTVSGLATQYGGIGNAATALGFSDIQAFHGAIRGSCGN